MLQFIKKWTLPLAMLAGIVTYPWMSRLIVLTPYLIFAMLFLTFCKLHPREIRMRKAHIWLLFIQLAGSVAIYGLLQFYNPVVAQGAFVCILVPSATSSAVIVGMLGGNVSFLTSYLLLCNIVMAVAAPALLPLVSAQGDMGFLTSFLFICKQVGPVLLVPLLLAWVIRYAAPKAHQKLLSIHQLSFYLWAVALTIVTASTVRFLVEQENPDYKVEISMALISLVICVAQFLLGRCIGKHYGDPISAGQGLGQKNTILAIWMAQAYLNPLSSVVPAAYVLWQNVINSYQLWLRDKKNKSSIHSTI